MTNTEIGAREDARRRRTRTALQKAFIQLFFERGFDEIGIADIAARAGVGRSTLYEHYRGKDELLLDTVRYPFERLAAVVEPDVAAVDVAAAVGHFWDNRANAHSLRRESSRRALARVYGRIVAARLSGRADAGAATARTAAIIAHTHLGVLLGWLAGDIDATPAQLADVLVQMARGAAG
ncbi:helix-turn-helix domain-containing protein [Dokdonella sp.]|uniref:TetR/AcrR family transcriptional regulator n=1 Tax=Dokdonella sp. TaxID=2291710 RepID=UPI002F40258C